jgi:membrane-bound ClpP family serine protease
MAFAWGLLGIVALFFGLVLLAFNGYEEDVGSGEWNTLPIALPVLGLGVALLVLGIREVAARKPEPPYNMSAMLLGGITVGLAIVVLLALDFVLR